MAMSCNTYNYLSNWNNDNTARHNNTMRLNEKKCLSNMHWFSKSKLLNEHAIQATAEAHLADFIFHLSNLHSSDAKQ
eukprot:2076540-Lingulodinium_polyedra.AAC.1